MTRGCNRWVTCVAGRLRVQVMRAACAYPVHPLIPTTDNGVTAIFLLSLLLSPSLPYYQLQLDDWHGYAIHWTHAHVVNLMVIDRIHLLYLQEPTGLAYLFVFTDYFDAAVARPDRLAAPPRLQQQYR